MSSILCRQRMRLSEVGGVGGDGNAASFLSSTHRRGGRDRAASRRHRRVGEMPPILCAVQLIAGPGTPFDALGSTMIEGSDSGECPALWVTPGVLLLVLLVGRLAGDDGRRSARPRLPEGRRRVGCPPRAQTPRQSRRPSNSVVPRANPMAARLGNVIAGAQSAGHLDVRRVLQQAN